MISDRATLATLLAFAVLAAAPAQASAVASQPWPDTPLARVAALAVLETLNATLLSHDSATLTLDDWCAQHHLAEAGTRVIAERVKGQDKPPTAEDLKRLGVEGADQVRYRRVRLRCGEESSPKPTIGTCRRG